MDRSNLVKIGTKYLTSDGTSTGVRCLTEIDNLHKFLLDNVGPVVKSLTGRPRRHRIPNIRQGVDIQIRMPVMTTARRDEIAAALDIASGTIDVTINGPSGSFHFLAIPGENPLTHSGKTRSGRVYDVSVNIVTHTFIA